HQAFDLEELRAVAGVDRLVSEAAPGEQGADRRLLAVHDADLPRGGVRAQKASLDVDVERVPQVARWMVWRDVEHLEVGEVVLDLRALVDLEPELLEDRGDLAHRLDAGVERAAADRAAGRRDVDCLVTQARLELTAAQRGPSLGQGGFDRLAHRVRDRPDLGSILRRQPTDPAQDRSEAPLLPEHVELERFE